MKELILVSIEIKRQAKAWRFCVIKLPFIPTSPECIGLKVVPVVESVKTRNTRETDYFFESYYTYENKVTGYETCPGCNGTGKVKIAELDD